jgi:hypothetical protein
MQPPTMYLLILNLHKIVLALSWAHVDDQVPLKAKKLNNAIIIHQKTNSLESGFLDLHNILGLNHNFQNEKVNLKHDQ